MLATMRLYLMARFVLRLVVVVVVGMDGDQVDKWIQIWESGVMAAAFSAAAGFQRVDISVSASH